MKFIFPIFLILTACTKHISQFKTFEQQVFADTDENIGVFPLMMEIGVYNYPVTEVDSLVVSNFFISKYQITAKQYCYFLNNVIDIVGLELVQDYVDYESDTKRIVYDESLKKFSSIYPDSSITSVSYYGTTAYCNWLNSYYNALEKDTLEQKHFKYRIPSDFEWVIASGYYSEINCSYCFYKLKTFSKEGIKSYSNDNFDWTEESVFATNQYSPYKSTYNKSNIVENTDSSIVRRLSLDNFEIIESEGHSKNHKDMKLGFRIVQQSSFGRGCGCVEF